MSIIFALPRYDYRSYTDLYTLIDLSDFETTLVDQMDPDSDNTYIIPVLNGEVTGWEGARAKIVVLDLEWRREPNAPIPGVTEFWTADRWHAQVCQCRYVPLGSHPNLRQAGQAAGECYDTAFIGYVVGIQRREQVRQQMIEQGVKVSPHGAWDDERHRVLSNSKSYLHVHQLAHAPGVPPLRMVVAAAYHLPVISEKVADAGIFADCLLQADYGTLAHTVAAWTRADGDPERAKVLADTGERLHDLLCHRLTFRKSIEAALG